MPQFPARDTGQVMRFLLGAAVLDQQRADHGHALIGRAADAVGFAHVHENEQLVGVEHGDLHPGIPASE